jgi:hypothetical protein
MAKQTRSPRHPNSSDPHGPARRPDPITSPRLYLKHQRGAEVADLIVDRAKATVPEIETPWAPPLQVRERERALTHAKLLLPYVRNLGVLPRLLEILIASWGRKQKSKRGRRLEKRARFAGTILAWAAGELGARGLKQLTATELIAAAVAVGLEPSTGGDKRTMLDSFRKLAHARAPANPQALADTIREVNRLEGENRRREAELEASEERAKQSYQTVSDYLAGCTNAGSGR